MSVINLSELAKVFQSGPVYQMETTSIYQEGSIKHFFDFKSNKTLDYRLLSTDTADKESLLTPHLKIYLVAQCIYLSSRPPMKLR